MRGFLKQAGMRALALELRLPLAHEFLRKQDVKHVRLRRVCPLGRSG
jgi:hypothetical protein